MKLRLLTLIGVVLVASPGARAATVDTPSLVLRGGVAVCMALNNSKKRVEEATLEILDDSGNVVYSQDVNGLDPGVVWSFGANVFSGGLQIDRGSCRLEGKFSKRDVKLTLCKYTTYFEALFNGYFLDDGCLAATSSP